MTNLPLAKPTPYWPAAGSSCLSPCSRSARAFQRSSEILRELAYTEADLGGVAARFASTKLTDDEIEQPVSDTGVACESGDVMVVLPIAARVDEIIPQAKTRTHG